MIITKSQLLVPMMQKSKDFAGWVVRDNLRTNARKCGIDRHMPTVISMNGKNIARFTTNYHNRTSDFSFEDWEMLDDYKIVKKVLSNSSDYDRVIVRMGTKDTNFDGYSPKPIDKALIERLAKTDSFFQYVSALRYYQFKIDSNSSSEIKRKRFESNKQLSIDDPELFNRSTESELKTIAAKKFPYLGKNVSVDLRERMFYKDWWNKKGCKFEKDKMYDAADRGSLMANAHLGHCIFESTMVSRGNYDLKRLNAQNKNALVFYSAKLVNDKTMFKPGIDLNSWLNHYGLEEPLLVARKYVNEVGITTPLTKYNPIKSQDQRPSAYDISTVLNDNFLKNGCQRVGNIMTGMRAAGLPSMGVAKIVDDHCEFGSMINQIASFQHNFVMRVGDVKGVNCKGNGDRYFCSVNFKLSCESRNGFSNYDERTQQLGNLGCNMIMKNSYQAMAILQRTNEGWIAEKIVDELSNNNL
jgi:hypothetical protein